MTFMFLAAAAVSLLFGWAILSAWLAGRRGQSEEKAHARACRRRRRLAASKRMDKSPGSIMVLGDSGSRSACAITSVSFRRLRICGARRFPAGTQVRVEWGEDDFIGYVSQNQESPSGQITDIAVSSTTYSAGGFVARFARAFQS